MLVYFFTLLLLFVVNQIDISATNVKIRRFVLLAVGLVFCFGYMTGSDWRQYEVQYYNPSLVGKEEIGFFLLRSFLRYLHVDFWIFAIGTKIFIYYSVCRFCRLLSKDAFYLSLSLFIVLEGLAVLIDFPMRNAISMAVSLYGFKYYQQRNIFKYLLVCFLATSFHSASLILISLYFIRLERIKIKYIVAIFILFNVFLFFVDSSNVQMYFLLLDGSNLQLYYDRYLDKTENALGKGFSLSYLLHVIFFFIILVNRERVLRFKYGRAMFLCGVLHPFLYRLGLVIPIFGRFEYFTSVFYLCVASKLVLTSKYRQILVLVVYLYLFIFTYRTITANYKFIPYTNYLLEFYKDIPFPDREMYNYKNSPYKE